MTMELDKIEDLAPAMIKMLDVCKQLKPYKDDPVYGEFHRRQFELLKDFANHLNVDMAG